jgi:threonine dehydrogenase-like Zn-dependent dehydrogenase
MTAVVWQRGGRHSLGTGCPGAHGRDGKVTASAMCGADLHLVHHAGMTGGPHEAVGEVVQVASAVRNGEELARDVGGGDDGVPADGHRQAGSPAR